MAKQKNIFQSVSVSAKRLSLLVAAGCLLGGVVATPLVRADQYDDQIRSLQSQNSQTQSSVNQLVAQADSYQDAINQLQAQINAVQAQIDDNLAKQAALQQQITDNENKLVQLKGLLGNDIKTMYVDGQMSTIEELATSKSLSDYVDKEEYRTVVQNRIQDILKQIATLQDQLQTQKAQVEELLKDEQAQRDTVAGAQAQQNQLLSYNESQQSSYNAQLQANNSQISKLRAAQAAAHARLAGSGNVTIVSNGSCGGDYPGVASGPYGNWGCNYGLDNGVDNWGMYNRECVSYTAWKVYQAYGYMPYWGGVGNADQWPGDADSYRIPRGSTPKVGSVAIGTNAYWFGPVGHAMWVEAVSGNQILVSQMNFSGPGQYSEMWIDASLINTFIYFGG